MLTSQLHGLYISKPAQELLSTEIMQQPVLAAFCFVTPLLTLVSCSQCSGVLSVPQIAASLSPPAAPEANPSETVRFSALG